MTKRAFDFCTWLILPTVYAEYVRSDQLAQVWASNSEKNFENTTEEVQKRRSGVILSKVFRIRNCFLMHHLLFSRVTSTVVRPQDTVLAL